jgi:serine/threonine protein kinase
VKNGDEIGGYLVVSDPTNAGGGKCMWAFAEKDGEEFFLKRFLEPKIPRKGAGGSAESRRIREETCRAFEKRHRDIMDRLRPDAPGAGNLVLATDFFSEGSTYYKVTERIDTSSLAEPHTLDTRQKAVLLRTLATSLRLLHAIDVVHGDLKPANVLVQRRGEAAFHTAKLIDFDDAYVAGDPPDRTEIAGDSLYGAPEWRRYVQGDPAVEGAQLTTAADVFALGLMTHGYLAGALPGYDTAHYGSPADAVNAGERLVVDARLGHAAATLVRGMTAADPAARPRVDEVLDALKDPEVCALGAPRRESRLRVNLPGRQAPRGGRGTGAAAPAEPAAPVAGPGAAGDGPRAPGTSRVRINLTGRPAPGGRPGPSGHRPDQDHEGAGDRP